MGSLRLASTPERLEELRRQAGWAQTFGLPLELISTAEALELFHGLFDPTDVLGAVWLPTDGWLNPTDLTMALAAGARSAAASRSPRMTRVTGIGVEERQGRRRVTHVDTDQGRIECEVVVNAGGMFAHEIGRMVGVNVPVVPMAHQYALTRPVAADPPRTCRRMRDPDRLVYFREEVGGLRHGWLRARPRRRGACDGDASRPTSTTRCCRPTGIASCRSTEARHDAACRAWPTPRSRSSSTGPRRSRPTASSSSARARWPASSWPPGFCAHGIAGAGGNGQVMAEWIVGGEPPMDLWKMDIRRFGDAVPQPRLHAGPHLRGLQHLLRHRVPQPRAPGRPAAADRRPPTPATSGSAPSFGEKSGGSGSTGTGRTPTRRTSACGRAAGPGEHWSTAIVTEHLAMPRGGRRCSTSRASPRSRSSGPGAAAFLQRLCANDVDKRRRLDHLHSMLNSRGGIECDFTVTRLAEERFLIVTGTAFGRHDLSWIRSTPPRRDAGAVAVRDVTSAMACFGLWGPTAARHPRRRLRATTSTLPLHERPRDDRRRRARAWALRVTYVGELGWELYAPTEYGAARSGTR